MQVLDLVHFFASFTRGSDWIDKIQAERLQKLCAEELLCIEIPKLQS